MSVITTEITPAGEQLFAAHEEFGGIAEMLLVVDADERKRQLRRLPLLGVGSYGRAYDVEGLLAVKYCPDCDPSADDYLERRSPIASLERADRLRETWQDLDVDPLWQVPMVYAAAEDGKSGVLISEKWGNGATVQHVFEDDPERLTDELVARRQEAVAGMPIGYVRRWLTGVWERPPWSEACEIADFEMRNLLVRSTTGHPTLADIQLGIIDV